MINLINLKPGAIQQLPYATLFYFGTALVQTQLLPAKSKFQIVHSPTGIYGWEFVEYQWFGDMNGLFVLGRRVLTAEEVAYFEHLMTLSNVYAHA